MRKWLFVFLVFGLLLVGCTTRVHTPRVLPEWGRAGQVGVTSRPQTVGLLVSPKGDQIVMAWPSHDAHTETDYLHFLVLDDSGKVLFDQNLTPAIPYLRQVQLLWGSQEEVHVFLSTGPRDARTLWYMCLPPVTMWDTDTLSLEDVQQLSAAEVSIAEYTVAPLVSGDVLILWRTTGKEVFAGLTHHTEMATYPIMAHQILADANIHRNVLQVDLKVDGRGNVHIIWLTRESVTQLGIYRALLDMNTWQLVSPQLAATISLAGQTSPNIVEGPILSLDRTRAYIHWTRRDFLSGNKLLYTLALPLTAAAEMSESSVLRASSSFPPPTSVIVGEFAYQHLAQPAEWETEAASLYRVPTSSQQRGCVYLSEEVVLPLSMQYATRTQRQFQPTLAYWRDGQFLGYQVLTWTHDPSVYPVVAADIRGNLYVAWLDMAGVDFQYPVYLASTAPGLHAAWRWLTWHDIGTIVVDYASRIASGVVLFPLIAMWFFLPFLWIFAMLSQGDGYGRRGRYILLVALFLYWTSKYLTTFQILTYIPTLATLPPAIGQLLIYLMPVLILFVSVVLGSGGFLRKRCRLAVEFSAMRTYSAIIMVDVILSLCVYAIGYFE
ncbi:MAG: hypothetical protein JXA33_01335 [Anaerolineae bacterium]|nr:hypothetical protein [Anaerolineae bacterium]